MHKFILIIYKDDETRDIIRFDTEERARSWYHARVSNELNRHDIKVTLALELESEWTAQ